MSKKTRQEKKLAAYRKRIKLLQEISSSSISLKKEYDKQPVEAKVQTPPRVINNVKSQDINHLKYFIKDLKKSLFIVVFIITLEILVYFVSIKDYLNLGS